MPAPVAIIVSHGQPSEPQVAEDETAELAKLASHHLPDWIVRGVTLAGDRTLEAALLDHRDQPVLIYPLFMYDGRFTKSVLPQRITDALAPAAADQILQLPPLGLDPGLIDLAVDAVDAGDRLVPDAAAPDPTPTGIELVVAGHGSGKSARPAEITIEFANAVGHRLGRQPPANPVRCGFVEQEPFLADVLAEVGPRACCLPFFAARRGHVLEDLPAAAQAARFDGPILDPIGCHPGIPKLIADALGTAD